VLSDLDRLAPAGLNRSRLIEAGLSAMLAATGWRSACVMTTGQAEEFRQLVKNRQQSSQPTPSEATAVRARSPKTGVLHVRISSFEGAGIAARVKQSLCTPTGGQVKVVLLDLRNNPGGRPEQANAVADLFLDNKILQVFAFRDGRRIAFRSNPGDVGLRVIVLANRFTGSAAEMLILALRDHHRAIVIGERTAGDLFGKDLQELRGGQVIVFRSEPTILSPHGEDYSGYGIPPDVAVPDKPTRNRDPVLERGLDLAGINQTSVPDR
jgi:C-terminal processing protease CtpA/Prc